MKLSLSWLETFGALESASESSPQARSSANLGTLCTLTCFRSLTEAAFTYRACLAYSSGGACNAAESLKKSRSPTHCTHISSVKADATCPSSCGSVRSPVIVSCFIPLSMHTYLGISYHGGICYVWDECLDVPCFRDYKPPKATGCGVYWRQHYGRRKYVLPAYARCTTPPPTR